MLSALYQVESANRYVYHYTSSATLIDHILPSRRLRLSKFCNTNDPRESKAWTFGFGTNRNFRGVDGNRFSELERTASILAKSRCRLLCATTDNTGAEGFYVDQIYERGFCKPRMWAHYAENHAGVCLMLDRTRLDTAIQNAVGPATVVHSGPVKYRNRSQAPSLADNPFMLNVDEIEAIGLDAAVAKHVERYRRELFFEKSTDWSPENEYRWMAHVADDGDIFVPIDGCLTAVVLGCDFPVASREHLRHFRGQSDCTVAELRWKSGLPEVIPASLANPADRSGWL